MVLNLGRRWDKTRSLSAKPEGIFAPSAPTVKGVTCNTALSGSANPEIHIDSDATDGTFMVNSIFVRTTDVAPTGFYAFSINTLTVDAYHFDITTANLTGSTGGTGVLESFDIMGTPHRLSGSLTAQERGGNFPFQIVADSAGANDIVVRFFRRSDIQDFSVGYVQVSGWKRINENISVLYVPGS